MSFSRVGEETTFVYTFPGFRSFLEELLLKPVLTRGLRVA